MAIPDRVHFCWIGSRLPWAYVFAILSAAEHGEMAEVILHHTDTLEDGAELRALRQARGVTLSRLDPGACLALAEQALGLGSGLRDLYNRLDRPVMRADMLRAAILYLEGGVYLDLDTITTASLRPLLDARQFIGTEFIVWPHSVRNSRSAVILVRHLTLDVMRKALRILPEGWRVFRRVENLYFRGVNNAIMGAEANSPLFTAYLRSMAAMPPVREMDAYALGPDMLQDIVSQGRLTELTILDPKVFYPLPPEISEHWFRIGRAVRLDDVLLPENRVVHWYASVRTKSRVAQISPAYVRENRNRQLYSALVCRFIQNLSETA